MKIAVVMNAGAGGIGSAQCEAREQEIRSAFAAAQVDASIHVCEPARLADTAREVLNEDIDAIVAAGGDGTVSTVASAVVDRDIPLAVIPLGTLNHFAKDLGMPIGDIGAAARAIAAFHSRRVDLGELNGQVFINNSSIGLYPEMVIARDAERRTTGKRKWRAMLRAAARVLRRFPLLRVRIDTGDRVLAAKTPFVFIGNNAYAFHMLDIGTRPNLDDGQLSLYMVRSTTRFRMFWLMVRAILQRLDAARDFEAHLINEAVITIGKRRLEVALDGEIRTMAPPLHYRSRPHALQVLVPPPVTRARVEPHDVVQGNVRAVRG